MLKFMLFLTSLDGTDQDISLIFDIVVNIIIFTAKYIFFQYFGELPPLCPSLVSFFTYVVSQCHPTLH